MQIDIVSDTICPWCHIGRKRLHRALASRPDLPITIHWHPFQLAPDLPREGVDRKEYLQKKFGGEERARHIYDTIREAGAEDDIDFRFDRIKRTPNTFDSHRLILWAGGAGCQDEIVGILFRLYFEEGADVGDPDVLAGAAAEAGMDGDLVRQLLAGDTDRELVQAEIEVAHRLRISGVPSFIIDEKYMISGAQEPEALMGLLDRIAAQSAATGEPVSPSNPV